MERMPKLNQIELVSSISKEVSRQLRQQKASQSVETRVFNAIVTAANTVCNEFEREPVRAKSDMGLAAWLASDDTGMSSKFLCYRLFGKDTAYYHIGGKHEEYAHPHDPSDFNRCVKFLDAVPEARERLPLVSGESKVWSALVANWSELEAMLQECYGGSSEKMYQRMKELGC